MAQTGRKPVNPQLRLVNDAHRLDRHGDVKAAKEAVQRAKGSFGNLAMPDDLDDEGKRAWSRYIMPAWWLDASREVTAIAFVRLWQKHQRDPDSFTAANHQQLRSYMAELGLTDERNRFGVGRDKTGDEFFDDPPA